MRNVYAHSHSIGLRGHHRRHRRRIFALRLGRKPWENTAHRISSILIRAASLPVLLLHTSWDNGIRISMDGRGRWQDNVLIERLWRSLKYENVYLNAYETGSEARSGIGRWISFYNQTRPHSSLDGTTPERCYHQGLVKAA